MMFWLTWLVSAVALAGVLFNIWKNSFCFVLWFISNAAWAVLDWTHDLQAQSALQTVYFGLSILGFWKWTKGETKAAEPAAKGGVHANEDSE